MGTYDDLTVFNLAYGLAVRVFLVTKSFPVEERYSLTDQVRRSSRSVCVNIVEAYRKKIYPKHFINKLSDADGECSETVIWLRMAKDFNYLNEIAYDELKEDYLRVGQKLGSMMKHPEKFN
jgi:four helix bundle protein